MYNWTLKHHKTTNTNLLDPTKVTQGYAVLEDGTFFASTGAAYSAYIPVVPGTTYKINFVGAGSGLRYCYFDTNKNFYPGGGLLFSTFTVPSDPYIKYVIISFTSLVDGLDPVDMSLSIGGSSTYMNYFESKVIHPIYKQISRDWEKQSGAQFYREKLTGNIKLINKEYDYVDALTLEQEIFIEISDSTGLLPVFKGLFYKTDCTWNKDDRTVEIRVTTDDSYEDFLGSLDKNFNLITLAPELEEVTLKKRPVTQVYVAGDKSITNLLGGTYWEQPLQTDPVFDHAELTDTYHFYNSQNIRVIPASYGPLLSTNVTGNYNSSLVNTNGLYKVVTETDTVFDGVTRYRYLLKRVSDNVTLYITDFTWWDKPSINYLPFVGVGGQTGTFYFTEYRIYVRLYTDAPQAFSPAQNTFEVPATDIVENNANYRRVIPYNVFNFSIYDHFTTVATRFGKVPDGTPDSGKYYKEFLVDPSSGLTNPLPISSSNWKAVSLWFFGTYATRNLEFTDGRDFQLRDAYEVGDVIRVLLRAIESPVLFNKTPEFSKVLYETVNPITGFTYLDFGGSLLSETTVGNLSFFITPKSNVVVGNYDQAATKADINLGQVLNMLRDVFKIYWHIENGKLRLEHISYYQKGGTYYPTPIVSADLTTTLAYNNGKTWAFDQNKYEFDKTEMPERFEFTWMDEVSYPFQGYPIIIRSKFVQKGRVENIGTGTFTTDVDYILTNPGQVSKDGFVLIGAIHQEDGSYKVPFIETDLGNNKSIIMQNGFLSWPFLHYTFYSFDLPAFYVNMNNVDITLFNNSRFRKQEVSFPYGSMLDPYKLVITALGTGAIDKMSIDLESLMIKATIKHDTE